MTRKKWLPHIMAVVSLVVFIVLGLASDGGASTPSSYSSDGSSSGSSISTYWVTVWFEYPSGGSNKMVYTDIKASSMQEAEDEGERRLKRSQPTVTVTSVSAIKQSW